jgi:transcriptional regulator with XRE-family HTH domain
MARRRIRHAEIVRLFADRLREVRLSLNLTQVELARLAHVPAPHISDLENAKVAPGIDLVDRLAKAMQTTATDLLPAATTVETLEDLKDQAKRLLEDVLQEADRDILLTVRSVLSQLRELSTRRR